MKNNKYKDWLYVGYLFFSTTFFFFDPTLYFSKILVLSFAWFFLVLIIFQTETAIKFDSYIIFIIFYVIFLEISKFFHLHNYSTIELIYPAGIAQILFLIYITNEEKKIILSTIDKYINLIIIITIPGLLFYFSILLGIEFKYELIHLGGRIQLFYRNYYNLAIFGSYEIFPIGPFKLARLCGAFEEPGMLGTILAILLITDVIAFPAKKNRKKIIILLGLFTLSFAFYLSLICISMYSSIFKKNKGILFFLVFGTFAFLILVPSDLQYAFKYLMGDRFTITNQGIVGDTRAIYSDWFENYLSTTDAQTLIFGNGWKSNQLSTGGGYSSYHSLIYEGGILGFSLVIIFESYLLIWYPIRSEDKWMIFLTLFPILSLYQRPNPLDPQYLVCYAIIVSKYHDSLISLHNYKNY
ncbi:MAG: hypothetical protein WC879_06160 [Melioribacteraceae bacterium]